MQEVGVFIYMRAYFYFLVIGIHLLKSVVSWGSTGLEEEVFSGHNPQISFTSIVQYPGEYAGKLDLMIPFSIDVYSEALGYGIVTGQTGTQGWQVGAGGGVRYTLDKEVVIGGYGLIEHQRSLGKNSYWRISPGLEVQWGPWHLSTNVYLPVWKNEFAVDQWSSTDIELDLEFSSFKNHSGTLKTPIFEKKIRETGLKGVDIVGSWQLNAPLKISMGGYYLPHETEVKWGMVASLAYQAYPGVMFEILGHQNQQETEVRTQVSVQLGALQNQNAHAKDTELRTRMLQRVGSEWVVPSTSMFQVKKIDTLENLYFYEQGKTGSTCTFEAPCGKISQEMVNQMPPHAMLLLAKSNRAYEVYSAADKVPILTFKNSQSLLGRSADFKSRGGPTLQSTLTIQGGSGILVDSIVFGPKQHSSNNFPYGILIHQARQVVVKNTIIQSGPRSQEIKRIRTGVKIDSSADVKVLESFIYSGEISVEISNSREIDISKNNIMLWGPIHTALLIDNKSTAKISRNKSSVTSDSGEDFSVMSHINGIERKAQDNTFDLSYYLPQATLRGTITANVGGPDKKLILNKEQVGDQWKNHFKRNDKTSSSNP